MEEEISASVSALYKNNSSSSAIRFLGLLKQPDSDQNPNSFELDESDVVWSSSSSDLSGSPTAGDPITDPHSPRVSAFSNSNSPSNSRPSFLRQKSGLSAALSDDRPPLVQRKPAMNPSLSATSAARTVPPPVTLPVARSSGSSVEDSFASSSGKFPQSAPVNVPVWPKTNSSRGSTKLEFFYEDDDEMDDQMLPPHEIVARSHMSTFSVFEGVGRTLKGRDLRRVRNAVWQKTGFLD